MVGPTTDESERVTMIRRLQYGFVGLVAVSCALITSQGTASLPVVAGVTVLGALVGAVLAWVVFPDAAEPPAQRQRRR
jgi:uncharacterized membrane protein YccC